MLRLPGGLEVPDDLLEFLGRQDAVSWCRAAGLLTTRALLSVPFEELLKTSYVSNGRARELKRHLGERHPGIVLGCLAEQAPEALAQGPPQLRAIEGGRQEASRETHTAKLLKANAQPW